MYILILVLQFSNKGMHANFIGKLKMNRSICMSVWLGRIDYLTSCKCAGNFHLGSFVTTLEEFSSEHEMTDVSCASCE